MRDKLILETSRLGIPCSVTSRPKEIDSLLRKAILKSRLDAIEDIHDKAGVRVTVYFPEDVETVCGLLRDPSLFDKRKEEDKVQDLGADRIGYLGIHFDIVLGRNDLPPALPEVKGDLWCEVQVHTAAQTLYATVSHPLLYKTPKQPDVEVIRAINRLSVVGEIFDSELARAREAIMNQPGYPEARLMLTLERQFLALTGRQGDPQITQIIVEALAPLYGDDSPEAVEARLTDFVQENGELLSWLYARNRELPADPLVMQPESLMIFERLMHDQFALKDQWIESGLPLVVLEKLAATYGAPITA